ncbi:hypothetical protein K431DRAFT_286127 [Polychaeton citri CBS 116435]|uniref:histidine kinase n=1 Tax=Polychaeton citri CBS 116435 TaxID=1314669 RepID=A0A9P4UMY5_9PEZI|nr:hypothetical protein K431DRAFT_286127 [Polychaeton citri CBS 116435]
MNPHPTAGHHRQDDEQSNSSGLDDCDTTPTAAPTRPDLDPSATTAPPPSPGSLQAHARPSLVRSPPARLSDIPRSPPEATADVDGGERDKTGDSAQQGKKHEAAAAPTGRGGAGASLGVKAVNARLQHQRVHSNHGPTSAAGSFASIKRPSPIREEGSVQSNPASAVRNTSATAIPTTSTISTESTDSARTLKGSAAATPAAHSIRTPSYPFPYIPGTPRGWQTAFHQPFTSLSPTVSAEPENYHDTPGRTSSFMSVDSTPGPHSTAFLPHGHGFQPPEDPRFPTPNLYDLVLQLNAEPGLDAWWGTVTQLMRDHFKAERVSLVVPADPTDIENVPWGQKATFSMNGSEEFVSHKTVTEQTVQASGLTKPDLVVREPSTDHAPTSSLPPRFHHDRLRPRLESRHSYAGPDPARGPPPEPRGVGGRPAGLRRTVTYEAGERAVRQLPTRLPSHSTVRHGSVTDPEFSSIAGPQDVGPHSEVFTVPRALDLESRPLIESAGVNRVLERGRVVTVTRDYTSDAEDSSNSNGSAHAPSEEPTPGTRAHGRLRGNFPFDNYRNVFASDNTPSPRRDYEEYEQYPCSPWAQSPAPSPAIQADEENNPFFATEQQQMEESFNPPTSTPKDYSQYNQVEAIGVDRASTVIHVPLQHPTLSQLMQPLNVGDGQSKGGSVKERKAPIGILSLLTSTVPYPSNLSRALRDLGPHMATSYATSEQFSSMLGRAMNLRHRRTASGHVVSAAPMTIEPTTLDDLVNAELEEPTASIAGSITSPSDYSGRSLHSPTGSIVGTPGWDPATHGWTAPRSISGTPAVSGIEIVDSYFDAKKRHSQRSGSTNSSAATPSRQQRKPSSNDSRGASGTNSEESRTSRNDRRPRTDRNLGPDKLLPNRPASARDTSPSSEPISPQHRNPFRHSMSHVYDGNDRRHSQLHSYGADFQSSFGALPSATSTEAKTPGTPVGYSHARKGSYGGDMLPPSERLLRTIIDSLPVQIFAAEPDTGKVTWVNSKFLIYRGQEPKQVLTEPWDTIHPDDRPTYMDAWNRSLRTGQQLQQKVRLHRFDGSYRWFYARVAPLKDKRQNIVHWIGTNMDFHEQHIAEQNSARAQETAASEAKYRALANSSPQIVFAVNKSKGVTFCNSRWLFYSGQTEAQALGVGFMDHVHPDDLAKCRLPKFDESSDRPKNVPTSLPPDPRRSFSASQLSSAGSPDTERPPASSDSTTPISTHMPQRKLSELASTGILKVSRETDGKPSYSTEVRLKTKDGEYRWHLVRVLLAESMLQKGTEEETWYGTCTDINDHKALERDLKETMDEKSRFLSNMSHEIRTPLNGITGMVNFLIDSSLTAEQMEHVNIIRASTEGLRGLINDILDLSKAEAGMIQLNMDWLHVRAVIEEVNDLTSAMAIDKGLELNYLVAEDVPSQIKGDRFRIRQILLNVIGNAIKFTQKGEVFVRCTSHQCDDGELESNERYIMFEIVDTGRGFTDKEAEYLFKRFSQIDGSSTRQHGGTGLGLVISRQLAQLHGGDMSAKGVTGKGSTFSFYIKTSLPSEDDQPPPPIATPNIPTIPVLPFSSVRKGTGSALPYLTNTASVPSPGEVHPQPSPKFAPVHTSSPAPYASSIDTNKRSPSSASSDPSLRSAQRTESIRSERSSASSYLAEPTSPMKLAMPGDLKFKRSNTSESEDSKAGSSTTSVQTEKAPTISTSPALSSPSTPLMFSILVVCPLKYSRDATVHHIEKTLPSNIPHQITAQENLMACQKMIGGGDPVIFTHIVVVLQDVDEIIALMDQVLSSPAHSTTTIVIITDFAQRRKIMEKAHKHNYEKLSADRRLRFVFKPLKPSRFAVIFDPQKEREMSTDRNQDSAQQVALNQKQVFDDLKKRLGNRNKRVLLVEDNPTNQMVILKFLSKVSIQVDKVLDGVQCTENVFNKPHDFYSVILCDLHMPNKDGYQTCKEIRQWERDENHPHLPIVALSANVLGDVYQKCVDAGFNSYLTKPVDFKELSTALLMFMDPQDPAKPHEFMKKKRLQSQTKLR